MRLGFFVWLGFLGSDRCLLFHWFARFTGSPMTLCAPQYGSGAEAPAGPQGDRKRSYFLDIFRFFDFFAMALILVDPHD